MLEQNITNPVPPHDHFRRVSAISRRGLEAGVVLLFCAVFAAMVISFSRNSSATYDEVAHLPAGYSYLHWDDYRLNPEHPPLVKKLAALPLLWRTGWPAKVDLQNGEVSTRPETDGESSLRRAWAMSFEDSNAYYDFGRNFLYGTRPGALSHTGANPSPVTMPPAPESFYNQADNLVFWGRMPILLLGLGLALLVFLWAREWFGLAGGILSLALFCFDPNFIAHSGQVTTDVGISLFLFGAVYFLWRICRRLEVASVVLFLLFFGVASSLAFKYPGVVSDAFAGTNAHRGGGEGEADVPDLQNGIVCGAVWAGFAGNLRRDLGVVFLPLFSRKKPGNGGEGRGANPEGREPGVRAFR